MDIWQEMYEKAKNEYLTPIEFKKKYKEENHYLTVLLRKIIFFI